MAYAITMLPAIQGHRMVVIEGDIDRAAAPEVRAILSAATSAPRPRRLTVDLSAARIHDDTVAASLADAAAAAQRYGLDLTVFDGGRAPADRTPADRTPADHPKAAGHSQSGDHSQAAGRVNGLALAGTP